MESKLINMSSVTEEKEEEEIFIRVHEEKKKGTLNKKPDDKKRPCWLDLPSDVRNYIYSHLSVFDCIRLTCIPLEEDYWSTPLLMFFSKPKSHGVLDFFHPISNKTYTVHIPELANCTFRCSRYGWLLMSRGTHSLFFYNPFIPNSIINLPDLHKHNDCMSISFTAPPTSPGCIVFAHRYYRPEFNTCCRGEDHWSTTNYKLPFKPFNCTPVFYKGVFYQVDVKGRLGASDIKGLGDGNPPSFTNLPKPTEPNIPHTFSHYNKYIAEYDGDFVSVFVDSKVGYPVHVFKLDWSDMEWVAVKSLGNRTMFVSETTGCLLVPAAKTFYQNKIFFPNFRDKKGGQYHVTKDKECVFYSLETCKYHTFGCDFSSENSHDMESFPNSVWIEPNVNIALDEVEDNWFNPLQDNDDNDNDNDCELNVQQRQ